MRMQPASSGATATPWVRAGELFEAGSPAHLADELRAYLLSLGSVTRTSLVRRVARLLAPLGAADEARVEGVCRALERRGDILGGPGGKVAAAPLRLVETHGDRLLVVGSLPTSTLRPLLPGGDVSPGVGRTARVAPAERAALLASLETVGGRLLAAEDWAGLSRTPVADAAWLDELAGRLEMQGAAGDGGLATRWDTPDVYTPPPRETPARRWQRCTTTEKPSLVRARQAGAWFAYGWGTLQGPNALPHPFVTLPRDEARRTEYALDRAAGQPGGLITEVENGLWWSTLDRAVPAAEYRFLLALAEERREEAWPVQLGFSQEAWQRASTMLQVRLGLDAREPTSAGA